MWARGHLSNTVSTWESFEFFSIPYLVSYPNLDLLQFVENVYLGKVQAIVSIDQARVLQHNQVQPSTTTSSACGGTILPPYFLQMNPNVLGNINIVNNQIGQTHIQLLSRKRSTTYTRCVGLHDTNCPPNHLRRNTKACAHTTNRSRRWRHKRIRAKVKVKHQCIRPFNKHSFACSDGFMHVDNTVHNVGSQPFSKSFIPFYFTFCVVLEMPIAFVSAFHKTTELDFKGVWLKEMVHSETRTGSFARIGRANAFLCRTDANRNK